MNLQKSKKQMYITLGVIAFCWLLMLGYTIVAAVDIYADNTVSNTTSALMIYIPSFAIAFGALASHWTWVFTEEPAFGLSRLAALLILLGIIGVIAIFGKHLRDIPLTLNFFFGYVLGILFFPQKISIEVAKYTLPFFN